MGHKMFFCVLNIGGMPVWKGFDTGQVMFSSSNSLLSESPAHSLLDLPSQTFNTSSNPQYFTSLVTRK